jgi:hypothetical protein
MQPSSSLENFQNVGQVRAVALKPWKIAEVNIDRSSDVSKVLEVKNTYAKFEQFFFLAAK